MKKWLRYTVLILLLWLLFVILCLVVPPLFHKEAGYGPGADAEGDSFSTPERILCIDDNKEALIWRLRLIGAAKERIILTTFDFRDEESGQDIMAALWEAAQRGVKVQILVDGINGMFFLSDSSHFKQLVSHEQVEARFYNPIDLFRPWRTNYRMHDKYLIADDWGYILGGRNTDNRFLGYYKESYNEDRDLLVYGEKPGQGSSFQALEAYFHEIWNQPCCKEFDAKGGIGGLEQCCERVKERYPEAFDRIYSKEDWEKATMETRGIELWTNPTEPENKEPVVWERMIAAMEGEEDILVQTPYMICSRKMYEDLRSVCEKGARVDIVINAVESGTNPFGCTDYLNQKKKICQTGVHIYAYLGDQAQHTKSLAVGEELSIIGSCNFDMRSAYLNTEMMLAVDCPELNASIREQAQPLKEKSRHMSPDGRTEDGQNYEPREQDMAKRAVYALLRIVISPFRHVL